MSIGPRRTHVLFIAATALATAVAFSPQGAGAATTHTVVVQNMTFMQGTQTVHLGDSVVWSFRDGPTPHTTTSDQGFWHSSQHTSGTYTAVFRYAGRYTYHCAVHPDMTGAITAPLLHSGSSSTGYSLRWSVATTTPSNRTFDLAVKRPGSTVWAYLRHGTTSAAVHYNPTPTGTYAFRARTHNLSNGLLSGWTPVVLLKIS
jgi:plastocyanin